ncbi:acyl-CoA dehydrogenase family protein [Kitasatospora cheerisanensis]|uniref:Acyl-CoA dehydrogenase n=1 Tax=Kitasatospora cheerisanensis KCTC 2395 TaxID=1348663 RepID=A0A066YMJ2_9ACTN|nr:acyl-CoA dehydrogenase family protein [Kitasatospora cheerisanensis]KDN82377.1 acyl-CoA dehydrogenase [Kitasatospora cheerisanensis KCTC 2395]
MSSTGIPTREEIVERVSALVPVLREQAAWSEENRRLSEETVAALAEAGVFRLRTPVRHGGYECDTSTLVEVAMELGRADGAIAWTSSVFWIPTWIAGLFPDSAQDEVFTSAAPRVCGTNSPTGTAVPTEGGILLNGSWKFVSGAWHAGWQEIAAILIRPDAEPEPIMALVPMTDLSIVDDWHTVALRGTGSVTTVAEDLFIPEHRIIPMGAAMRPQGLSHANADSPVWRTPASLVAAASGVGVAVGLAKAAREVFFERLPGRKITYTDYTAQNEAPITHLRVAEAVNSIDQAEFHARRAAATVDAKAASGEAWKLEERAQVRNDQGEATRLAKHAVDTLVSISGGSSIYLDVPLQKIARDIQAVALHALINPDTNAELYGRVLCGLEPNTLYI